MIDCGPKMSTDLNTISEMTHGMIRKLIVCNWDKHSYTPETFEELYASLPNLEVLSVRPITNRECGIEKCTKLRELTIVRPDLSSEEVSSLRESFAKMPNLKKLSLTYVAGLTSNKFLRDHNWGFIEDMHISGNADKVASILWDVKGIKRITIDNIYQKTDMDTTLIFMNHEVVHLSHIGLLTRYMLEFKDVDTLIIDDVSVYPNTQTMNVTITKPVDVLIRLIDGKVNISHWR
jgi:hypothetical protein